MAKVEISSRFNAKQQAFLDFVLAHYVDEGVQELDQAADEAQAQACVPKSREVDKTEPERQHAVGGKMGQLIHSHKSGQI